MTKRIPQISLMRAYERNDSEDGHRVRVDRLWPRRIAEATWGPEEWLKTIAPSTELRRWFHHAPEHWTEFKRRYRKGLSNNAEDVEKLIQAARDRPLVLTGGARDEEHNHAVVLRDFLLAKVHRRKAKEHTANK